MYLHMFADKQLIRSNEHVGDGPLRVPSDVLSLLRTGDGAQAFTAWVSLLRTPITLREAATQFLGGMSQTTFSGKLTGRSTWTVEELSTLLLELASKPLRQDVDATAVAIQLAELLQLATERDVRGRLRFRRNWGRVPTTSSAPSVRARHEANGVRDTTLDETNFFGRQQRQLLHLIEKGIQPSHIQIWFLGMEALPVMNSPAVRRIWADNLRTGVSYNLVLLLSDYAKERLAEVAAIMKMITDEAAKSATPRGEIRFYPVRKWPTPTEALSDIDVAYRNIASMQIPYTRWYSATTDLDEALRWEIYQYSHPLFLLACYRVREHQRTLDSFGAVTLKVAPEPNGSESRLYGFLPADQVTRVTTFLDKLERQFLRQRRVENFARHAQAPEYTSTERSVGNLSIHLTHNSVFDPTWGEGSRLLTSAIQQLDPDDEKSLLEIGTGAGHAALLSAQRFGTVVATDINEHAVGCARYNAEFNKSVLRTTIAVHKSDLFESLPPNQRFDYIVFNPPWLDSQRHARHVVANPVQRSMADGDVLDRFLQSAEHWLKPGGRLLIAVGDLERSMDWFVASFLKYGYRILTRRELSETEKEQLPSSYDAYPFTFALYTLDRPTSAE